MRTAIIVGFIGVSLATLTAHSSHATIVSANWDIPNNIIPPQTAFDFHVLITRPGGPPTNHVNGAFSQFTHDPLGPPNFPPNSQGLTWSGGSVPQGGMTHVGVEFDDLGMPGGHGISAFWSNAAGTDVDSVGLSGFEAHPLFGNVTEFSLFDDTDTSLLFHNLQFQPRPSRTPLDQLIPYTLPGFGASVPDFTLLPGQSMAFDINAGPNDFVLAQMITYDPSNPTDSIVGTVFQVGTPVPEPTTWAMMLLGFAGLGFMGLRRARSGVRLRAAGN